MAKKDRSQSLRDEIQELREEVAARTDRTKTTARHAEVLAARSPKISQSRLQILQMRTAKVRLARCRYCVVGDEFRPMTQRDGGFICANCGHIAKPGDKDFKCFCLECSNL